MDIVIRSLVIFVVLWLVIRVSGKREIAQLSAFDMILLVTLGDLVSQGVVQEDYSLTAAILAATTFALASVVLGVIGYRFPRSRPVIDGSPRIVVRDGEPNLDVLDAERLTIDDLREAARERGIRRLSDIEMCVLETDGGFSFFERDDGDGERDDGDDGDGDSDDGGPSDEPRERPAG